MLVDAGRFAYTGAVAEKFRPYAKGTQGHNSVLIDGKGQMPDVRVTDKPLSEKHWKITPEFDYAWNSFDKYYDLEDIKHNRSMMYVRDNFWVVVDKIETKIPREIKTLWHFHPDCKIGKDELGNISTKNRQGNLTIVPVKEPKGVIDVIKGQEVPEIQGWYSKEYNKFEPNDVVIYSTKIKKDKTFVWLLFPSEKVAPEFKAKIISENSEGIKIRISEKAKGTWNLSIPYSNSKNASLAYTK